MEPLIQVDNLFRYYGPNCAVRDVSFELRPGEVLGFLGPNGAGKSTTMQIISGVMAPSAGQVRLAGIDLLDSPRAAKRHIGYLPETPPLYPDLTVDEQLRFSARLHGMSAGNGRKAVDKAKDACGLSASGKRLIANLSKGYRQRVGIAQAILHGPDVVILDEPTSGLDPNQIRDIRELVENLARDRGVILSTHILPEVQAVCDRIQIIHQGEMVLSDTNEGLLQRMKTSTLRVAFDNAPGEDALGAIAGIERCEAVEPGVWRLFFAPDQDPTDILLEQSVSNQWRLRELLRERRSLEEIFSELTTGTTGEATH